MRAITKSEESHLGRTVGDVMTSGTKKEKMNLALICILEAEASAVEEERQKHIKLPDDWLAIVIGNPALVPDKIWKKTNNTINGDTKILIRHTDGTLEVKPK